MKLRLKFGQDNVLKPLLSKAVLKSGVAVNILEAKISSTSGEMVVDAQVGDAELSRFAELLRDGGVIVEELVAAVEIDAERCISCGACVTLCPTDALVLSPEWQLRLDGKLCIGCERCVPVCPVGAIRSLE
jgi:MinD superfamily P-loop ATPase